MAIVKTIEFRCPRYPRRLFGKLRLGEPTTAARHLADLIEFACRDCGRDEQQLVLHLFTADGSIRDTVMFQRHTHKPDPDRPTAASGR